MIIKVVIGHDVNHVEEVEWLKMGFVPPVIGEISLGPSIKWDWGNAWPCSNKLIVWSISFVLSVHLGIEKYQDWIR